MAYYSSYTDRFGETISADNAEAFVDDIATNNIAFTNNEFVISGPTAFTGSVDGVGGTDLVFIDRVIRFTSNTSTFVITGTATDRHVYFLNCTFQIDNFDKGANNGSTPTIGHAANNDNGERSASPSDTKASARSMNFINCDININADTTDTAAGRFTIYASDMRDSTLNVNLPDVTRLSIYVQPKADLTNLALRGQTLTTAYGDTFPLEITGEPRAAAGMSFDGLIPYNFEAGSIELKELAVGKPANVGAAVAAAQNISDSPVNNAALTLGNGNGDAQSVFVTSPKVNLRPDGRVYYRSDAQGNVIMALSHQPTVYDSAALDTARSGVQFYYDTNVSYTTGGNFTTITSAPGTTHEFTTNSSGQLNGGFDFKLGTQASNVDIPEQEIPLISLVIEQTNDQVTNDETLFSTTYEMRSLFGTIGKTDTFSIDDLLTTPDDDGFFIPPVVENIGDAADPHMPSGITEAQLEAVFDYSGSLPAEIDVNDVYSAFKLAWKDRAPYRGSDSAILTNTLAGTFSLDENPYDNVTAGVFDISGAGSDGPKTLVMPDPNSESNRLPDGTPYEVRRFGDSDIQLFINASKITKSDADTITGIKADTIRFGNQPIEFDIEVTGQAQVVDQFSTLPADPSTNYTANDCVINGTLQLDNEGSNLIAVLNDVDATDLTLTVSDTSGTGVVNTYLTGSTGTPSIDSEAESNINLFRQVIATVNLATAITAIGDATYSVRSSADGSTFADIAAADLTVTLVDSNTITVQAYVPDGSDLYLAISADQNTLVAGSGSEPFTLETASILTTGLDELSPIAGGTDTLINTNTLTVTKPTSNTADIPVRLTWTLGSNATSSTNAARLFLRRVEKTDEWMESVAEGLIPANYFEWDANNVTLGSESGSPANPRLDIQKAAASNFSLTLGTVVLQSDSVDAGAALSEGNVQLFVGFSPQTSGASYQAVQDIVNGLKGSGDRDLTNVYDKVKNTPALLSLL